MLDYRLLEQYQHEIRKAKMRLPNPTEGMTDQRIYLVSRLLVETGKAPVDFGFDKPIDWRASDPLLNKLRELKALQEIEKEQQNSGGELPFDDAIPEMGLRTGARFDRNELIALLAQSGKAKAYLKGCGLTFDDVIK